MLCIISVFFCNFGYVNAYELKNDNIMTNYSVEQIENLIETGGSVSVSDDTVNLGCTGLLGSTEYPTDGSTPSTAYYLQTALDILRYVGIAALIVMSIIDYAQAVAQSDADALKNANSKVIKRLMYTVILFVFPIILEFIFELTGIYDDPFCGLDV